MRIRNKLTYKFTIIVASLLLIFSLAIYFFSATFRAQEFDKRLIDKGLTAARLLIRVDEVDIKLLRIIDRNNLSALQHEKITVYDSSHHKLYSSDDDPEVPISDELFREIRAKKEVFFNHGKNEVVGAIYQENNDIYFVIVSAYDQFGINKLNNLKIILCVGFMVSMGGIFIGGWIFSGQAIKPISEIVNKVKNISATNLHLRIDEGNGQDEIAQLAIQFNQMLKRLEQAFETQRNFVSNASHELRTPLSTIRTQLEIMLSSSRNNDEYKETLHSVLEDINNIIRLSNGLLDLAQASFDTPNNILKKVRLDELLYQSISDVSKKYHPQQISLHIENLPEDEKLFIISGNETLLKTAFVNILDNACKYSDNNPVIVNIRFQGQNIIVSISDTGIGIRQGELLHIFDPFYRGSNVRDTSGHGIGLALSQKIIQLHNGRIELFSQLEKGTTAMIHLPHEW